MKSTGQLFFILFIIIDIRHNNRKIDIIDITINIIIVVLCINNNYNNNYYDFEN